MTLYEKIVKLRKAEGLSQEALAEKLNVSRQAVSRWESGTASPDASNILQLSKLFGVTADYLLNDDYESDRDLPPVKDTTEYFQLKIKKDARINLFCGFCWLIAAFCFLGAAIDNLSVVYLILVFVDIALAVLYFVRYFRQTKGK